MACQPGRRCATHYHLTATARQRGLRGDIEQALKPGKLTSFPQSVKLKPDEVVVFSWVSYRSRAHRDRVVAKVLADPRLAGMSPASMPFDGKRMIFGGFKPMLKL